MLSIDEALALVLEAVRPLGDEELPVADALDRVLAEDVVATHDVPRFANSAMDGFAVRSAPKEGRRLRIVSESRAGAPATVPVGEGEAIRISTGAALPAQADAVVPVENTHEAGGEVVIDGVAAPGENVRNPGEDLCAGDVVLPAGTRLGPAELGLAVAAGRATIRCARRPLVSIVATGDELVDAGERLGPGQIHDSNALSLAALANRSGATVVGSRRVGDDAEATRSALAAALDEADLVVVSGGVSVGPHDHVKPALAELRVEERFWRVALRPGKPTWFGLRGDTLVLGLPGNPVSALVTFLLFARPALAALQGAAPPRRHRAVLAHDLPRHPARDEMVRVRIDDDGRAHATGPQGSHVLSSMLGADGLALIPRGEGQVTAETLIEIEPI